jgi:2-methylaconitate cis-trans-isomerase PrpF
MGLVADPHEARLSLRNLPLVALVSRSQEADLRVRMFSSDQPHKASPLTGAMALAAAAAIPGTLAHDHAATAEERFRLAHASGLLEVTARGSFDADQPVITETTVMRTARLLMTGRVYF